MDEELEMSSRNRLYSKETSVEESTELKTNNTRSNI
jgi:hypothetical protein